MKKKKKKKKKKQFKRKRTEEDEEECEQEQLQVEFKSNDLNEANKVLLQLVPAKKGRIRKRREELIEDSLRYLRFISIFTVSGLKIITKLFI